MECTGCPLRCRYADFVGHAPTFAETKRAAMEAVTAARRQGDYRMVAGRRKVLGMMHQAKRDTWRRVTAACEADGGYRPVGSRAQQEVGAL